MTERYKDVPRITKACRWLRYKPWYALGALLYILNWVRYGCPEIPYSESYVIARRNVVSHFWGLCMSKAEIKMGNYLTSEEFIAQLRTAVAETEK